MKRFKEIALIATSCFMLTSLAFLVVLSASADVFGAGATGEQAVNAFAADITGFGFDLFAYSLSVGVSFLIFNVKRLPAFAKRALHLVFNYALMTAFFLIVSAGKEGRTLMLFVLTFLFIVVYFVGMLVCRALKRLGLFLDEASKRKQVGKKS